LVLHCTCNYINDKKEGKYISYHPNGKLSIICNYIEDEINGEFKSYNVNGFSIIKFNHDNKIIKINRVNKNRKYK